jgi:hypothetical protein
MRSWRRTQTLAKSQRALVTVGSCVTGGQILAGGERRLCVDLTGKLTDRPTTAYGGVMVIGILSGQVGPQVAILVMAGLGLCG